MKTIYKTKQIMALLLVLLLGACELEETLYSSLAPDNFFVNEQNSESGVIAIYKLQNKIYGNTDFGMPRFSFLPAPHAVTFNNGFKPYSNYTFSTADGHLLNIWKDGYRAINQANMAVGKIPQVDMPEGKKAELIAEAKFLRTYNYFNMVRFFGSVPFSLEVTKSEADAYAPFSSVEEVYQGLLGDLSDESINALPINRPAFERGRVTRTAALTLKAKIMLTMAGKPLQDNSHLSEAATILTDLVDNRANFGIGLLADYPSIFSTDNKLNEEVIFAIQNDASVEAGGMSIVWTSSPPGALSVKKGSGLYAVSEDWYYDSFIDGDKRREVIVESFYSFKQKKILNWGVKNYDTAKPGGLIPWKHRDPNCVTSSGGSTDFIVLRFADVLLMHAEVENELNGVTTKAIDAINEVLSRANANTLDYTNDPTATAWTKESLREFIFQERMRELCFEWHEIFDIRRMDKVQWSIETSVNCIQNGTTYDPSMELFPIPANEMNARD
jgi:hypothetical protein